MMANDFYTLASLLEGSNFDTSADDALSEPATISMEIPLTGSVVAGKDDDGIPVLDDSVQIPEQLLTPVMLTPSSILKRGSITFAADAPSAVTSFMLSWASDPVSTRR